MSGLGLWIGMLSLVSVQRLQLIVKEREKLGSSVGDELVITMEQTLAATRELVNI